MEAERLTFFLCKRSSNADIRCIFLSSFLFRVCREIHLAIAFLVLTLICYLKALPLATIISRPILLEILFSLYLYVSIASAAIQCSYPAAIPQSRATPCHPNANKATIAPRVSRTAYATYRSNIHNLHRDITALSRHSAI